MLLCPALLPIEDSEQRILQLVGSVIIVPRKFLAYLRYVRYHAKACGASLDRSGRPRLMLKTSFNLSMCAGSRCNAAARSRSAKCSRVRTPTMAEVTAGFISVQAIATTNSFSPIARHNVEYASNC